MAGFQIFDTYKAYKLREKKVTTWLKETAQRFGFKFSSLQIRIREIPEAVKLIVSKGEYLYQKISYFQPGYSFVWILRIAIESVLSSVDKYFVVIAASAKDSYTTQTPKKDFDCLPTLLSKTPIEVRDSKGKTVRVRWVQG